MKKIAILFTLLLCNQAVSSQETEEIVEDVVIEEVEEQEVEEQQDIPFAVIENPPIFPGCSGTRQEKKDCLNRSIQKHVAKKFNLKSIDSLGLSSGKQKIYIQFKIDKNGEIDQVRARGPHKKAEAEGIRVIKLLPKMVPGTQRGRNVNVRYMLPISFNVQ